MCFSASVSFATSALLLPTGLYSLWMAKRRNPSYIPLAAIPIGFAIQQACEGMVWWGIQAGDRAAVQLGAVGFLTFAYWIWLFWGPWAVAHAEPRPTIRRISFGFSLLGVIYGILLYFPLLLQPDWIRIRVMERSLQYVTQLIFDPWFPQEFNRLIYGLIILIPFTLASRVALKFFGVLILISALLSQFFLNQVFVSVWCFFAAVLSIYILYICQTSKTTVSH